MAQNYIDVYECVIQQANVMREAKELAKTITLQEVEEPSVVPDASAATRESAGICAAFRRSLSFQDALSPSFLPRPTASREVSAYL